MFGNKELLDRALLTTLPGNPEFERTLLGLLNSGWEYWLAGSRVFGCATPESDWDFYVEWRLNALNELLALGFAHTQGHNDYSDRGDSFTVLEKVIQSRDGLCKDKINIMLCSQSDMRACLAVQNALLEAPKLAKDLYSIDPPEMRRLATTILYDVVVNIFRKVAKSEKDYLDGFLYPKGEHPDNATPSRYPLDAKRRLNKFVQTFFTDDPGDAMPPYDPNE